MPGRSGGVDYFLIRSLVPSGWKMASISLPVSQWAMTETGNRVCWARALAAPVACSRIGVLPIACPACLMVNPMICMIFSFALVTSGAGMPFAYTYVSTGESGFVPAYVKNLEAQNIVDFLRLVPDNSASAFVLPIVHRPAEVLELRRALQFCPARYAAELAGSLKCFF